MKGFLPSRIALESHPPNLIWALLRSRKIENTLFLMIFHSRSWSRKFLWSLSTIWFFVFKPRYPSPYRSTNLGELDLNSKNSKENFSSPNENWSFIRSPSNLYYLFTKIKSWLAGLGNVCYASSSIMTSYVSLFPLLYEFGVSQPLEVLQITPLTPIVPI